MVESYWVCHWKKTFWVGGCDGIGGLAYLLFCAAYWFRQQRVFRRLSRSCLWISCVRNKIMYVLEWRTVSALTQVLFLCLFPSLLCNSGNKHKNNPLVSTDTFRYSSTYIILYIFHRKRIIFMMSWHGDACCITDPLMQEILQSLVDSLTKDKLFGALMFSLS